jgi:hypothetical protein
MFTDDVEYEDVAAGRAERLQQVADYYDRAGMIAQLTVGSSRMRSYLNRC